MKDLSTIAVTGFGTVHPAGRGWDEIAAAFRDGILPLQEIDRSAGYHRRDSARLGGLTAGLDLSPWISPRAARRMSLPSKLATAATRMALDDAGLEIRPQDHAAVFASNSFGPSSWVERFFHQIFTDGPTAASPALFTETVANAPAAHVALTFKATGPNVTLTQREAGGLLALLQAAGEVVAGRSACAIVLMVDELTPLLHAALDRFKALARAGASGDEVARPFDRRRNGYVVAEGATALVLEHVDAVRRRGGKILARLHSGAGAFDPRAPNVTWSKHPEILTAALRRYLERAGIDPATIGTIVSGASGSRNGDALEAKVLQGAWKSAPLPDVLTPKAFLGEQGGAVLTAAILALGGAAFAPTPGFEEADPDLEIVPHAGGPLSTDRLLLTNLASGGAAAWVILEGASG